VNRSLVVAKVLPDIPETLTRTIRVNDWLPPKAYFDSEIPEVNWLLLPFTDGDKKEFQRLSLNPQDNQHGKSAYHSFDCSIMDVADDIAYGVHDLEDAIHLKLITKDEFNQTECRSLFEQTSLSSGIIAHLFDKEIHLRKQAIGEIVNYLITATTLEQHDAFENPLLKYQVALQPEAKALLNFLMGCIYRYVIDSQEARTFEYGGQTVVLRLFEAISSNPSSLLDEKNRQLFLEADTESAGFRVVCDYIANMTDEYAYRMHERLFGFNTRTIFERL
jgi:dGTPase